VRVGGDLSSVGAAGTALDTTGTASASGPPRIAHRGHCWRRVAGGVVCLVLVVYALWLATRLVRAVEKIADKYQGRAP
jgi:hypothetical protein